MSWYFVDSSGNTTGPLAADAMKTNFVSKKLTEDSHVWNGVDVKQWTPLKNVPQLLKLLKPNTGAKSKSKSKFGGGGGVSSMKKMASSNMPSDSDSDCHANPKLHWCWEDAKRSGKSQWKAYDEEMCDVLTDLCVASAATFTHGNTSYVITKQSANTATQINQRTRYVRNVRATMSDSSNYNSNNERRLDPCSNHSNPNIAYNDIPQKMHYNNNNNHTAGPCPLRWQWNSHSKWNFFDGAHNDKLNALPVGGTFQLSFGNTQYSITKYASDSGEQQNMRTKRKRQIRAIPGNMSNSMHVQLAPSPILQQQPQPQMSSLPFSASMSNNISYHWYWNDGHGKADKWKSLSKAIATKMDHLSVGSSFSFDVNGVQYSVYKVSDVTASQMNQSTKHVRKLIRYNKASVHAFNTSRMPAWMFKYDLQSGLYCDAYPEMNLCLNVMAVGSNSVLTTHNRRFKQQVWKVSLTDAKMKDMNTSKTFELKLRSNVPPNMIQQRKSRHNTEHGHARNRNKARNGNHNNNNNNNGNKRIYNNAHQKLKNMDPKTLTLKKVGFQANTRVDIKRECNEAAKKHLLVQCRIVSNRIIMDRDLADNHFRKCESQYLRSCAAVNTGGGQMRKTLSEIIYVINPILMRKYKIKEKKMIAKLGLGANGNKEQLTTVLAWHGTAVTNVESITRDNFSLAHLAKHTGNRGAYGAGIYFSEFANVSKGYGAGLLLCKVILGKSYAMTAVKTGCGLQPGYDSHIVAAGGSKFGQEIVIFDVDQILPCYIVKPVASGT